MISNILTVGGIGSLLFSGWLILFSLSGWVKQLRDDDGNFKKQWNWKAVLSMLLFISFMLGLLLWGNYRLALSSAQQPSFLALFINAFGIFLVIHLYDLVIIDYLLIVKWHPEFLKLPETKYYNSITPHIRGFFRGIPMGIIASIASCLLFFLFT